MTTSRFHYELPHDLRPWARSGDKLVYIEHMMPPFGQVALIELLDGHTHIGQIAGLGEDEVVLITPDTELLRVSTDDIVHVGQVFQIVTKTGRRRKLPVELRLGEPIVEVEED